jgi:hypothetical protein
VADMPWNLQAAIIPPPYWLPTVALDAQGDPRSL